MNIQYEFLKSALTLESNVGGTVELILKWLQDRNEETAVSVNRIPFSKMKSWVFKPDTGNLCHESGRFFSIEGLRVKTNSGNVKEWEQPVIHQPEIGILGFICKKIDGALHFLVQSKIEPGNINYVQLSPTMQATKSNYSRVHKGKMPKYAEFFLEHSASDVLVDQLQSEQGSRFLRKRNRNIIILVYDDVPVDPDFRWMTLGQLKALMRFPNVINMDSRTVISCISFGSALISDNVIIEDIDSDLYALMHSFNRGLLDSALQKDAGINSLVDIFSWITEVKTQYELQSDLIPLKSVKNWIKDEDTIHHKDGKYFQVLVTEVVIGNREIVNWCQPLVQATQDGIIAFLIKKINGVYHFLVQAKIEAGNFDIIELAPTVQCINHVYEKVDLKNKPPYLDEVLKAEPGRVRYDVFQSEEGGRFFRAQNRNVIIEVDDDFSEEPPFSYIWMTLSQMMVFIQFNNYFNIEARSLISAISFREGWRGV